MVISALSLARGTSVFQENIFENRFRFISELKRFGADIDCNCKLALINGVRALTPARVNATDLRGGAALVVAALAADGESVINNINYIERGYDGLDISLNSLGADIKRN
jgi:UDP-N-acetylglucosamine 1-carboxyvinyltransferase